MIWESYPWRHELCVVAQRLEAWSNEIDWEDERIAFEVERDTMVSAYAIRKLLEAEKLPDSIESCRIRVMSYPLKGRVPDSGNWDRIDEHYDFLAEEIQTLELDRLCNQFIHSDIWMREGDPVRKGMSGIFVASDWVRKTNLYRVNVESLIRLFRDVGVEEVTSLHRRRDSSGQWVYLSKLTADEEESGAPNVRVY